MKRLAFLITFLILPLFTFAQPPAPQPITKVLTEKEQKIQIQKDKVIYLVEKTVEEATFWEDKKTAVEVMVDAADLLWQENSGKSEKWLMTAWKMIDEVSESKKDEKMSEFFNRSDKADLQTLVLEVAQKHDAELAEKFISQLSKEEPKEKKDKGTFDDKSARSEQLLRLAQSAIETNPNLAFNLAERSLADGISYSLQNVLTDLRKTDVNLANRLFDLALARFINTSPETSEAQILVGYLFKPGFTMGTNSSGGAILVVNPGQQNLPAVAQSEPVRTKNLLTAIYQHFFARPIVLDTLENKRNANNVLLLGYQVVNHYNQFAPQSAQSAQAFLTQLQSQINPGSQSQNLKKDSRLSDLPKDATKEEIYEALIDDLEEKADNETDPIAKKMAYVNAAISTKPEDYKRGETIAQKINDEILQEDLTSFILYRAVLHFVEKKEIETAEQLAPQIKEILRRSVANIAIAQALLKPKTDKTIQQFQIDLEKQRAFDLLNDVQKDLIKENANVELVKILFGVNSVLAKFDKTQALSSLEQTVQIINKLEELNLKNASAPKLGIDISPTSSATISTPKIGFGFRNAVEPLIRSDFEQIALIVERLSKKEIRGVGRLEIAKQFFHNHQNSIVNK